MSGRKPAQVHWYRPERQKWCQLTVRKSGIVYANEPLQEKLHGGVEIGLVNGQCFILLADCRPNGIVFRQDGVLHLPMLAKALEQKGIRLPLAFLMKQVNDTQWEGSPLPYTLNRTKGAPRYDLEQTLLCYAEVIERAVNQVSGTPIEDRRSIAKEAVWEVLQTYGREDGPLETVLAKHIREQLKIKKRTSGHMRGTLSLDADLSSGKGMQPFQLYGVLPSLENTLASAEKQLLGEQFQMLLTEQERRVFSLLLEGATPAEIAETLCVSRDKIYYFCERILLKYQALYRDDQILL